ISRDVPDDVLESVGRTAGVVMVTFVPSFLTQEGAVSNVAALEEAQRLRAEHPDDSATVRSAMGSWFVAHPDPPATVSDVADHVDHMRQAAGIDPVGAGSDFSRTRST